MNKKLSIITINFNNLAGLKKTVESVINQTWQEFEYIIIDGGSTDGSAEYLETQKDKIHYWVSEPDKGIYNAMNKGIVKASGEYILFLNSGDHLFNDYVLEKYNHFIDKKDFIYFRLQVVNGFNSFIKDYPENLVFSYFFKETLPHPSTFIRRDLFKEIEFYDESLKIVSDWKFFIECICKNNASYIKINETLSTFYLDGLSSNQNNQDLIVSERQLVLEANFSTYLEDVKQLYKQNEIVLSLKKSKKIQLLIKLGLLNKF